VSVEDAAEVIRRLGLERLPREGGWFREVYRSPVRIPTPSGPRSLFTSILYLLDPKSHSAIHRLSSDEIWQFHAGDPAEMLLLFPGGRAAEEPILGPDIEAGMKVQQIVPPGTWQGARLRPGGRWALLGTTVSPGFEPADFEPGDPALLAREYPAHAARIRALAPAGP
jgi:predicted cupin superfamily sugar epimerase